MINADGVVLGWLAGRVDIDKNMVPVNFHGIGRNPTFSGPDALARFDIELPLVDRADDNVIF